jgi:hypothetical protein
MQIYDFLFDYLYELIDFQHLCGEHISQHLTVGYLVMVLTLCTTTQDIDFRCPERIGGISCPLSAIGSI